MTSAENRPRHAVPVILTVLGIVPFAGAAVAAHFAASHLWAVEAQLYYAAVIASFLGGVHWGIALAGQEPADRHVFAVAPSLLAWLALLLPSMLALPGLAALLLSLLVFEHRDFGTGLPLWYLQLRGPVTSVAVLCLLFTWLQVLSPPPGA